MTPSGPTKKDGKGKGDCCGYHYGGCLTYEHCGPWPDVCDGANESDGEMEQLAAATKPPVAGDPDGSSGDCKVE